MKLRELLEELIRVDHTTKTLEQLLDTEVEFFTGHDGAPFHLLSVYESDNGQKICIDIGD